VTETAASLAAPLPTVGPVDPHRAPHLPAEDRARILGAAHDATTLGLGAIGELVRLDLKSWCDFGHRLDQHGLAMRVVAAVEAEKLRRATTPGRNHIA
jgi:hypothetical protein